jgi:transcriptional regulator with XRE-family HTH domain
MKERLLEFLRTENKSSAQLAEEIGVQPSGISHILSGRNNPSLDFVLKMLEKYQFISGDWLLFGKGSMYKEVKMQTLFDESLQVDGKLAFEAVTNEQENNSIRGKPGAKDLQDIQDIKGSSLSPRSGSSISHIVIFYNDRSFEEYTSR